MGIDPLCSSAGTAKRSLAIKMRLEPEKLHPVTASHYCKVLLTCPEGILAQKLHD